MKAQEEERTRIAAELHDSVIQQLTTANLSLGVVKHKVARGADANGELSGLEEQLIRIGTDIRQLSHELHPAALNDAGLPQALANYCSEFSSTRGIPISCDADANVKGLSLGTALALYRITQEALGNVAKHAKAKAVEVRLARDDGKVRLTVSDDGVGFNPARSATPPAWASSTCASASVKWAASSSSRASPAKAPPSARRSPSTLREPAQEADRKA